MLRIVCQADSGSFTFSFRGVSSADIPFDAAYGYVEELLEAMDTVSDVEVSILDGAEAVCGAGAEVVTEVEFLQDFGSLPAALVRWGPEFRAGVRGSMGRRGHMFSGMIGCLVAGALHRRRGFSRVTAVWRMYSKRSGLGLGKARETRGERERPPAPTRLEPTKIRRYTLPRPRIHTFASFISSPCCSPRT